MPTAWSVTGAERTRERFVRFVPGVEGDLGDGAIRLSERPRRSLHPQPSNQLEGCLADYAAKNAMEVKRRQACAAGERVEIERVIEIRGDVLDGALH